MNALHALIDAHSMMAGAFLVWVLWRIDAWMDRQLIKALRDLIAAQTEVLDLYRAHRILCRLARRGFVREDPAEVEDLTQQGIRAAIVDLERGDWRAARTALNAVSDIHRNATRSRYYLTEDGKAVKL